MRALVPNDFRRDESLIRRDNLSTNSRGVLLRNPELESLIIEDSAKLYDHVMKLWTQYISVFDINYHEVKYENLVNNLTDEVNKLFKFLELSVEKECYEFFKTKRVVNTASFSQVRKPIFKESINKWKNYERELQDVYLNLNQ